MTSDFFVSYRAYRKSGGNRWSVGLGEIDLIYSSARERASVKRREFARSDVDEGRFLRCLAVDEAAHGCVSDGHDSVPRLPHTRGSATESNRRRAKRRMTALRERPTLPDENCESVNLKKPRVFAPGFARTNLISGRVATDIAKRPKTP